MRGWGEGHSPESRARARSHGYRALPDTNARRWKPLLANARLVSKPNGPAQQCPCTRAVRSEVLERPGAPPTATHTVLQQVPDIQHDTSTLHERD
jgi:hypothetical protein